MNKAELRKLLAQLQKARAKVDLWPDDFPREDSGASIPNSYSPDEQAALIASSPFASSLDRYNKLCIKTAFLPPEDQLQTVIDVARNQFAGKIPFSFAVQHMLWMQPQFTAIHYRLARAVQPLGKKLDPLAATIGAIRLRDKACGGAAAQHLSDIVIKAFSDDDKNTLDRIKKLSTTELRKHRNFQIWIAIEETIKEHSKLAIKDDPQTMVHPTPTTSDIRRFVENRLGNESFDDLPGPKDHKGWTRLWENSGASQIIPKGVRGKIA